MLCDFFRNRIWLTLDTYRERNALVSLLSVVCIPLSSRDQGKRRLRALSCPNSSDLSRMETKAGEALVFLQFPNTSPFLASPFVGKAFAPEMSDMGSLFENFRNFVQLDHISTFIFINV